jgi:polyphosphate:AMP phosphotransferase
MLDQVDLSQQISKEDYKKAIRGLELKLGVLQRRARELKVPVILVFEGWNAAGKGTLINKLLLSLDPRGFTVHPFHVPNEEERLRPWLWRFWTRTPERGRIAIFDRSWYGRLLGERLNGLVDKADCDRAATEINAFERQLTDDGTVMLKFFLHISKKEQRRRFDQLENNPATSWKVNHADWQNHKRYKKFRRIMEEALAQTDTAYAPWTLVAAEQARFAAVRVFTAVADAMASRIASVEKARPAAPAQNRTPGRGQAVRPVQSLLDRVDLSQTLDRAAYEKALEKYQDRLWDLEHRAYKKRLPVIVMYEGWDAAGKGGNIKRLVQGMDPRGFEVIPVAAPNDVEMAHHYLWRFWVRLPKAGHIAIFDRSWYGRVLVERVEGFCSEAAWRRAYREINEFEESLVNFGAVLVKFWLQISPEEQLKRFKERQKTAAKQWKITDEDWRNRKKMPLYRAAVDDMLQKTSTAHAPWTIVESNDKLHARIKALRTVTRAITEKL